MAPSGLYARLCHAFLVLHEKNVQMLAISHRGSQTGSMKEWGAEAGLNIRHV